MPVGGSQGETIEEMSEWTVSCFVSSFGQTVSMIAHFTWWHPVRLLLLRDERSKR